MYSSYFGSSSVGYVPICEIGLESIDKIILGIEELLDHKFSMNPESWRDMVDRSRELEYALGTGVKRIMDNEKESVIVQRRGLCASHDLKEGHIITSNDLVALRPCSSDGIEPYKENQIIGKKINCKIANGENITKEMFA